MAGKDIIIVRQKELKRLHVIKKIEEGVLTQGEAASIVSLSERQMRRIVKRIREEGDRGIVHRSRGRESNRKLPQKLKDRIIALYRRKYEGFGPTLMTEKLEEMEGIKLSDETVRTWLIAAGEWKKRRRRKVHRQWRPRKSHRGEMVQLDGSHHDWFEGRGAKCVLMGYIDDASGKVFGRFYKYEGTIPAMDSFKRYIRKYGIPMSVYMDKHTTYKSPAEPSIEEELAGIDPLSEFGRALTELGVKLIHANSPQAKGRVERLFKTLQDRLVKEMRIRGISSIEEANKFLVTYLPSYNKRFAVKPAELKDLHREIPKGLNLDEILCIRTERRLRNDNTVAHNKRLYQVKEAVKGSKVEVEDRINGALFITYNGIRLPYTQIMARPPKQGAPSKKRRQPKSIPPAADHPWRIANSRLFMKKPWRKKATEAAA